jgi:hypothetical protein
MPATGPVNNPQTKRHESGQPGPRAQIPVAKQLGRPSFVGWQLIFCYSCLWLPGFWCGHRFFFWGGGGLLATLKETSLLGVRSFIPTQTNLASSLREVWTMFQATAQKCSSATSANLLGLFRTPRLRRTTSILIFESYVHWLKQPELGTFVPWCAQILVHNYTQRGPHSESDSCSAGLEANCLPWKSRISLTVSTNCYCHKFQANRIKHIPLRSITTLLFHQLVDLSSCPFPSHFSLYCTHLALLACVLRVPLINSYPFFIIIIFSRPPIM